MTPSKEWRKSGQVCRVCVYGRLFSPEEEQWDEPERENAPKDRNKSSCVLVEIAPVRISTSVNIGKFDKSNLWKFLPRKKKIYLEKVQTQMKVLSRGQSLKVQMLWNQILGK